LFTKHESICYAYCLPTIEESFNASKLLHKVASLEGAEVTKFVNEHKAEIFKAYRQLERI